MEISFVYTVALASVYSIFDLYPFTKSPFPSFGQQGNSLMSQNSTSAANSLFKQLEHHKSYYLNGGDIHFLV